MSPHPSCVLLLGLLTACSGAPTGSTPGDATRKPAGLAAGSASSETPAAPGSPAPGSTGPTSSDNPTTASPTAASPTETPAPAVSSRSTALNTEGYRAYKKGDLQEAARLFRAAIDNDDANALAHYNLACTLALLRSQGSPCEYGASLAEILDHLARAVSLDEGRRSRMRQDSDLDVIRGTLRYRILDQGMPADDAGLRALLTGVTLYNPPSGVWGSTAVITLAGDGSLALTERVLTGASVTEQAGPSGRWSVSEGTVRLEIGSDVQELTLREDGSLGVRDSVLWTGHESECSA